MSKDTTVRYTSIPEELDHPALTIRWWFDYELAYFNNIISMGVKSDKLTPTFLIRVRR
jgi:hypothetical protein